VQAVAHMLKDGYLADVPIVVAAIDPCFSCTDRAFSISGGPGGVDGTMNWQQLRQYSIDWYKRERGVDFAGLRIKQLEE
jgi:membrane-bound hydrogenase subunit alpha